MLYVKFRNYNIYGPIFTIESYLKTVFVALLDAAFCSCETGNGDCVNDGRTTVVVTGLCPLGLITEAGGLEV